MSDTSAALSNSTSPGSVWDTATWDSGIWVGSNIIKDWQGVTGVGYCAAPRVKVAASNIGVRWMSTDLVFEPGAIL